MDELDFDVKKGFIILCFGVFVIAMVIRSFIMIASNGGGELVILIMFIIAMLTAMYVAAG